MATKINKKRKEWVREIKKTTIHHDHLAENCLQPFSTWYIHHIMTDSQSSTTPLILNKKYLQTLWASDTEYINGNFFQRLYS